MLILYQLKSKLLNFSDVLNSSIYELVTLADVSLFFSVYFYFFNEDVAIHSSRWVVRIIFNVERRPAQTALVLSRAVL